MLYIDIICLTEAWLSSIEQKYVKLPKRGKIPNSNHLCYKSNSELSSKRILRKESESRNFCVCVWGGGGGGGGEGLGEDMYTKAAIVYIQDTMSQPLLQNHIVS